VGQADLGEVGRDVAGALLAEVADELGGRVGEEVEHVIGSGASTDQIVGPPRTHIDHLLRQSIDLGLSLGRDLVSNEVGDDAGDIWEIAVLGLVTELLVGREYLAETIGQTGVPDEVVDGPEGQTSFSIFEDPLVEDVEELDDGQGELREALGFGHVALPCRKPRGIRGQGRIA